MGCPSFSLMSSPFTPFLFPVRAWLITMETPSPATVRIVPMLEAKMELMLTLYLPGRRTVLPQ